jgi:phosphoglycerate-specific signal transduction histidine kinase
MENDILSEMEQDAEVIQSAIPKVNKLEELSELVEKMLNLRKRIERFSERLETLTKDYEVINGVKIPDLFDELQMKKFTLMDGRTIAVDKAYVASITKDNANACFDWLKANGHDSIIKHELTIKFKKGETAEHNKLVELAKEEGVTYTDKDTVHPQTLKAFVNEQMENGTDFPQDLFKVFQVRKTKIS